LSDKAGTTYILAVSDSMQLTSPLTNVDTIASVASVVVTPTDTEDIETYRARVLLAYLLEPNGGAAADYMLWALDSDECRAVYPYTLNGGTAQIFVEAVIGSGGDNGNGAATTALCQTMWLAGTDGVNTGIFEQDPDTTQTYYQRGRRQLGLISPTISSVTPLPVVVTITNLKTQTDTEKASITTELTNALFYKRPFISGAGNVNDRKDTLYFSDIDSAIQKAVSSGNTYDTITITVATTGTLPYKFTSGNIPYLSQVIYD
jgi:hypothetical protein